MRLKHPSVLALPALVALAVAGCGSNNGNKQSNKPAPASKPAGNRVAVTETEYKLSPANPAVKKGTLTLSAANKGKVMHSLEVEGPGGEKRLAKPLQPGQSGTLKVNLSKAGKYTWYCPIDNHKGLGMKGKITVGGGGSSKGSSGGGGGGGYSY
jgi:uncharacterized cupredoxin-like copper-binding protein